MLDAGDHPILCRASNASKSTSSLSALGMSWLRRAEPDVTGCAPRGRCPTPTGREAQATAPPPGCVHARTPTPTCKTRWLSRQALFLAQAQIRPPAADQRLQLAPTRDLYSSAAAVQVHIKECHRAVTADHRNHTVSRTPGAYEAPTVVQARSVPAVPASCTRSSSTERAPQWATGEGRQVLPDCRHGSSRTTSE